MFENEGTTSAVTVRFVGHEESQWRAADLMPKEACMINNELHIKLGTGPKNDVELHVMDAHRMDRGATGAALKKHFFFHVESASIVALSGDTKVVPHRVEIIVYEVVTFTARSPIPFDRETHPLTLNENWNQEVTDAD